MGFTYLKYRTSINDEQDKELKIDQMTWRQWLNNALKRTHGLFGESIEYHFLNQDDKIAYFKVRYVDSETFATAIATYTSTDELVGAPLVVNILQQVKKLEKLDISEDDKIWLKNRIEEEKEDNCM